MILHVTVPVDLALLINHINFFISVSTLHVASRQTAHYLLNYTLDISYNKYTRQSISTLYMLCVPFM